MLTQEEIVTKVNELAKLYLASLTKSRIKKEERLCLKDNYIKEANLIQASLKNKKTKKENNIKNSCRWTAKKFNITFPKTEAPKEKVLHFFKEKLDIKEIAIGQEFHEDGNKHLHVYMEFVGKKNIKSPRYFDLDDSFKKYGNIHPNISTLGKRTKESWFRYITMEDKQAISWGFDIWAERLGKLKLKDIAGKILNSEWKLKDWIKYDPSILFTKNIKKFTDLIEENINFTNKYCNTNYNFYY